MARRAVVLLGISAMGEGYMYIEVYEPLPDCAGGAQVGNTAGPACQQIEATFSVVTGHTYWVRVFYEWNIYGT